MKQDSAYFNSSVLKKAMFNGNVVAKAMFNGAEAIDVSDSAAPPTPPTPSYENQYLTFVALEDGTFKFSGNPISYSLDSGSTWSELASNTASPTIASGDTIMWKATLTPVTTNYSGIGRFSSTGRFNAEGNILSLIYGDDFIGKTDISNKRCTFGRLFYGCNKLVSAENMAFVATTMSIDSYRDMFSGCTSLTTAPSSIGTSATTIEESACAYMFNKCTALVTPPALPATLLGGYSYAAMFNGCSSLETAPVLPATTLAGHCYHDMFNYCTSLSSVTCLAISDITTANCQTWLYAVKSSGVFTKAASATWTRGASAIPNNWTVEDYQPQPTPAVTILSPEYLERDASHNGYLPLGEKFSTDCKVQIDFQMTNANGFSVIGDYLNTDSDDWRIFINYNGVINNYLSYDFLNIRAQYTLSSWSDRLNLEVGNYYVKNLDTNVNIISQTSKSNFTRPNQMYLFHLEKTSQTNVDYGKVWSIKIFKNNVLVKDYIPWTDGNGNYGMFDKVNKIVVNSIGNMTGSTNVTQVTIN